MNERHQILSISHLAFHQLPKLKNSLIDLPNLHGRQTLRLLSNLWSENNFLHHHRLEGVLLSIDESLRRLVLG